MTQRIALVVITSLLLLKTPLVLADVVLFDRSCNAVQHVQQQARLKQMEAVNAQGTKEYRQTLAKFKYEMDALFAKSERMEQQYNEIRNAVVLGLVQERQDLIDKHKQSVAAQRPDLVAAAQNGDAAADLEFRNEVLKALDKDSEFQAELRRRMDQQPEAGQIVADAFKLQVNQFHDLEVEMAINRWKAPPDAASQQLMKQKTVDFVGRQYESRLQQTVLQSRAMMDLMTVKNAIQSGLNASLEVQNESGAMALRDRYDTPVPDATTDLADVPPVVATPVTREVLGRLEASRLQSELDFIHLTKHIPEEPKKRNDQMRDPEKPLAAPIAETTGAALERHRRVREGYERLSKFKEPPPPDLSASRGSSPEPEVTKVKEWVTKVATSLEKAATRTKYVLIDDENEEEAKTPGGSK